MPETKKLQFFHRNILGDAKATIDAIQKYIKENSPQKIEADVEENETLGSLNRVLNSVKCDETNAEIDKIIKNL
jgi:hypothetical protein